MTRRPRPSRWRCNECGASGTEPTRLEAADAFTAHWIAHHQDVMF